MPWWRIVTLRLKERTESFWRRCLILCSLLSQTFTIHKELKSAVWTERHVRERAWKLLLRTKLFWEDCKTSKPLIASQDGKRTISTCVELETTFVNSLMSLEKEIASTDRCSALPRRVVLCSRTLEAETVTRYRCLTSQEQPRETEDLAATILCNQISAACQLNPSPRDLSSDKPRH